MIKRELVEPGSFKQVRENKSSFASHNTHSEDCEFIPPIYKWYCLCPSLKCNIKWTKFNVKCKRTSKQSTRQSTRQSVE